MVDPTTAYDCVMAGELVIDLDQRDVRRQDGRRPQLSKKAIELLLILAAQPGQFVSRERIQQVIWAGRIVETSALNNLVFQLRLALGDQDRRILETLPKRGLVLHGHAQPSQRLPVVQRDGDVPSFVPTSLQDADIKVAIGAGNPVQSQGVRRRRYVAIVASALLLAVLLFLLFQLERTPSAISDHGARPGLILDSQLPKGAAKLLRALAIDRSFTRVELADDGLSVVVGSTDQQQKIPLADLLGHVIGTSPARTVNRPLGDLAGRWQQLNVKGKRWTEVEQSLIRNIAHAPSDPTPWVAYRDFLMVTEAHRDINWLESDRYFAAFGFDQSPHDYWNSPAISGHSANLHSWVEICRHPAVEDSSWMRGNCHFKSATDLMRAHQNSKASAEFALAKNLFELLGDLEKAQVADRLMQLLSGQIDATQAQLAEFQNLRSSEDLALLMGLFERADPALANEVALRQMLLPWIRKRHQLRADFASVSGRAAMRMNDESAKREAIRQIESEQRSNAYSKNRSSLASTLMDVYGSLGEVGLALDARARIEHPLPPTFACISGLYGLLNLNRTVLQRDLDLCHSVRETAPDFVSLSLISEAGRLVLARLDEPESVDARWRALSEAWSRAPRAKPNWHLATRLVLIQAIALNKVEWAEEQWESFSEPHIEFLARRAFAESDFRDWIASRKNPAQISGAHWPPNAAIRNDAAAVVQALMLETLKLRSCVMSTNEAQALADNLTQRGAVLAAQAIREIAEGCATGAIFTAGATWPVFY